MERMDFTIKPLTPIFTGGIEGKCDRLHETGLIGSLRWWFEVLVRGMGGFACDPNTHVCKDGNYCDVCKIFGVTGQKRAFRLKTKQDINRNYNKRLLIKVSESNFGWYLQQGITNNMAGSVYYHLRPWQGNFNDEYFEQTILLAFALASQWGGIGAGTPKGFGASVFNAKKVKGAKDTENKIALKVEVALEGLEKLINRGVNTIAVKEQLPVLGEFFFTKYRFNTSEPGRFLTDRIVSPREPGALSDYITKGIIPISPLVRYHLRHIIRNAFPNNHTLRHQLMGVVKGRERQKSLINISHAYAISKNSNTFEFRIWGWVPPNLHENVKREAVIDKLKEWTKPGKPEKSEVPEEPRGELWERCNFEIDCSHCYWVDMQGGNIKNNIEHLFQERGESS